MPTETVYGLAADALNPKAVARIFAAKERPTFDPLIVHVPASMLDADSLLDALSARGLVDSSSLACATVERVETLLRAFWPGPLTVVLPRGPAIPDLVCAGLPTVALRMPAHPVAQRLLELSGRVLAAPSANRFGRISPTRVEHVVAELGDRVPFVVEGGPCRVGLESSIVMPSSSDAWRMLRPGEVSRAAVESVVGFSLALAQTPAASRPDAPGMLASHYAPSRPLMMLPAPLEALDDDDLRAALADLGVVDQRLGFLRVMGSASAAQARLEALTGVQALVQSLDEKGQWEAAARRFFDALRALDASDAEVLVTEPAPSTPALAFAIADRLRRACAPRD